MAGVATEPPIFTTGAAPGRRPGLGAWLLMLPIAAWLVVLVVAPTAILVVYSFCQRDDYGQIVFQFTLDNYRRIGGGPVLGVLCRAGGVGLIGAFVAVAVNLTWRGKLLPPSPGTPGEGRGEGDLTVVAAKRIEGELRTPNFELRTPNENYPHPSPVPDYRERGLMRHLWRDGASAAVRLGFFLSAGVYIHHLLPTLDDDDCTYFKIFWRSAELAGLTTLLCLVVGLPVAFFIGRSPPRWRGRLLLAVMIPFWTSFLIRTYAWITILKEQGLLNGGLRLAGFVPHLIGPVNVLYTPTAVVIGLVYAYLPFMILPIFGSIEKLDPSLVEAALDLGARPHRVFASVVLPLAWPGMVAGIMLVFVPAIGMFAVTDLMGGSRVEMIGNVIQNQFGQAQDWPFGAALGVTLIGLFGVVLLVTGRGKDPV